VRGRDGVPAPRAGWAYFFDVDGTLAEFAPTPAEVRLDAGVLAGLRRLHERSGGAVALVSGRSIADVDSIFHSPLPVAGQHGLERRDARGVLYRREPSPGALDAARVRLAEVVARHAGLLLEDKGLTLALHYRRAPALAAFSHRTMRAIQRELGSAYATQPGKCVVELKPASMDKGVAVTDFLREAPFMGRIAVFVGDDATDEHGFAVVNALGGHTIKVGGGPTTARWRLASVAAVSAWMAELSKA